MSILAQIKNSNKLTILALLIVFAIILTVSSFSIYKVRSSSMINTLLPNDYIIILRRRNSVFKIKQFDNCSNKVLVLTKPSFAKKKSLIVKRCIATQFDIVKFTKYYILINDSLYYSPKLTYPYLVDDLAKLYPSLKLTFENTNHGVVYLENGSLNYKEKYNNCFEKIRLLWAHADSVNHLNTIPISEKNSMLIQQYESYPIDFSNQQLTYISGHNIFLIGDNLLSSNDSRSFGQVNENQIIGKAIILFRRNKKCKSKHSFTILPVN